MTQTATLRVGIDVGGTFTDLAAVDTVTGERTTLKVSSTPQAPERGVIAAIELLLAQFSTPPRFEHIAHSTTIATNALLGQIHLELPRVVFLTTAGFRDVIEIGRQNRSQVYNLLVTRPKPLVARGDRVAVRERMDYRGGVLLPLEQSEIDRAVQAVRERRPESIAIGFLHSYANAAHERAMAAAVAAALPAIPVTLSSEIDPEYREYERFSTAVVNAALMPIVRGYIERLAQALKERGISVPLYVMQSNGGLAAAERIAGTPAAIIESGPASGVIAAAELAREKAIDRVLSFDMGGTSAKTGTIVDGVVQVSAEFEAAGATHSGRSVKGSGYPVRFPFVDLAEISAGGGTIAWIDEAGALRVGPLSAGADPGPACYGGSDRATVTDANVVLGRLNQEALAGGTFPIDASRSHAAIALLAETLDLSVPETAAGIVRIVDAQMAKVLHIVTTERGLDPRAFALVAFGGNGPLTPVRSPASSASRASLFRKIPASFQPGACWWRHCKPRSSRRCCSTRTNLRRRSSKRFSPNWKTERVPSCARRAPPTERLACAAALTPATAVKVSSSRLPAKKTRHKLFTANIAAVMVMLSKTNASNSSARGWSQRRKWKRCRANHRRARRMPSPVRAACGSTARTQRPACTSGARFPAEPRSPGPL